MISLVPRAIARALEECSALPGSCVLVVHPAARPALTHRESQVRESGELKEEPKRENCGRAACCTGSGPAGRRAPGRGDERRVEDE